MRILVTGGEGFIGSRFISWVATNYPNHEITSLDSRTYGTSRPRESIESSRTIWVLGDVRDKELVQDLVSASDMVVHFAAESHNDSSITSPEIFFDTNVMGTLNVVQSCVKFDVRLHHISTDEVFGDLPLDSDARFDLNSKYFPSSPYSASKAASDHIIRSWVRTFGLRATISNCSNNYGIGQHWEKLIPHTIKSLVETGKAPLYGSGLNVRDWIHVDDHVEGVWLSCLAQGQGQTYLFGANNCVSNLSIVRAILEAMGMNESAITFVPDRPGHDRRYAINAESSAIELGWAPKHPSVLQEIPKLVDWYLSRI